MYIYIYVHKRKMCVFMSSLFSITTHCHQLMIKVVDSPWSALTDKGVWLRWVEVDGKNM